MISPGEAVVPRGAAPVLLRARNLTKRFGAVHALENVTFDVREGEILGLIGPNGAGKTTLLEGLAGLMPLDRGDVLVRDVRLGATRRKRAMFYLPDCRVPYPELPTGEVLRFWSRLYRATPEQLSAVTDELRLDGVEYTRVGSLSKGYRRRLLLALALLTPQHLLMLDEPFDGLDLRQVLAVIELLRQARSGGRTLLLSVHQLADAQRICDRFMLLNAGRMLGLGTLGELRDQAGLQAGNLEDVFLALT
jgi:ABC-2 type transport system ATP-binding protein